MASGSRSEFSQINGQISCAKEARHMNSTVIFKTKIGEMSFQIRKYHTGKHSFTVTEYCLPDNYWRIVENRELELKIKKKMLEQVYGF